MASQSKPGLDRILVTGGAGFMASALNFGIPLTRKDVDFSSASEQEIASVLEKLSPGGILHLASADIRESEKDPALAYQVNVRSTESLARFAGKRGIPFYFVSTGALFRGGPEQSFREDATPDPVNIYGKSKYASELLIRRLCPEHLIVRSGWCYGPCGRRKRIVDAFAEAAVSGRPLRASRDQWGSPTLVSDFAGELRRLILGKKRGTFHVVNSGRATAAGIARKIVGELGSHSEIEEFDAHQSGQVPRSSSEVLESGIIHLRSWEEALIDYLRQRGFLRT